MTSVKLNLASPILHSDDVNGYGLREVIFAQGCKFHCYKCWNKNTWSFKPVLEFTIDQIIDNLNTDDPMIDGISLLGGDPFFQADLFYKLLKKIKKIVPEWDIWVWTGYKIENLLKVPQNNPVYKLLEITDILIDGQFIYAERNLTLNFRGSNNQKIIDVKKTLLNNKNKIVLAEKYYE
jgi:anaerobic ribonucleoside-triphosphate reductase activating protein